GRRTTAENNEVTSWDARMTYPETGCGRAVPQPPSPSDGQARPVAPRRGILVRTEHPPHAAASVVEALAVSGVIERRAVGQRSDLADLLQHGRLVQRRCALGNITTRALHDFALHRRFLPARIHPYPTLPASQLPAQDHSLGWPHRNKPGTVRPRGNSVVNSAGNWGVNL